jgi:hypothetical protein
LRLYGLVLLVATLIRTWIDLYLDSHPGLRWTVANKRQRRVSRIAAAAPLVVYIVAMLLADVAPGLSLFLFFAMPGIYFALVTFLDTGSRTKAASEDPS